jgi:hypothetical protein
MAKNFEKLIFGGLHEKHAVQRGIWVTTQHLLWDQGKPRKTLIELAAVFYLKLNSTLYICPYLPGNTLRIRYESNKLMFIIYSFVTMVLNS